MQDRPTERVRVLLDGLTASAIVDRVHPYYSGYQFDGEWLDTLKESVDAELDDLDRTIRGRAGTVGAVDRLREYVANAPASSMGEMARAIVRNYCDAIEVEAGDPTGARRFAERLEAAAAERADVTLFGVDYTAMPIDADGEVIHAGDVMEFTYDPPQDQPMFEVSGFGANGTLFYAPRGEVAPRKTTNASVVRHHATTVEGVLREFTDAVLEWAGKRGTVAEVGTWSDVAAEYAAKLRLAGEE